MSLLVIYIYTPRDLGNDGLIMFRPRLSLQAQVHVLTWPGGKGFGKMDLGSARGLRIKAFGLHVPTVSIVVSFLGLTKFSNIGS